MEVCGHTVGNVPNSPLSKLKYYLYCMNACFDNGIFEKELIDYESPLSGDLETLASYLDILLPGKVDRFCLFAVKENLTLLERKEIQFCNIDSQAY